MLDLLARTFSEVSWRGILPDFMFLPSSDTLNQWIPSETDVPSVKSLCWTLLFIYHQRFHLFIGFHLRCDCLLSSPKQIPHLLLLKTFTIKHRRKPSHWSYLSFQYGSRLPSLQLVLLDFIWPAHFALYTYHATLDWTIFHSCQFEIVNPH